MEEEYDIFIGSEREYKRAVRKNAIKVDPNDPTLSEEAPSEEPKKEVKIGDLSKSNLKKLDDEMLTILRRTRTVADYETVYMQHKLDFYDDCYNNTNMPEELKAVKRLRRIYRNYREFLEAIRIRDDYLMYLIEKYGGEAEFSRKASMGLVREWIPPAPKLSKKCPDYDLYLTGMLPMDEYEPTEEELAQIRKQLQDASADLDVTLSYDVETDIGSMNAYKAYVDKEMKPYANKQRNAVSAVSVGDLRSLQSIFKSWYRPDTDQSSKRELFCNAPENIRKRFLEEKEFNEPGLLTEYVNGLHKEDDTRDPNEMVFDQELGRAIPYKEWVIREDARLFERAGWSKAKILNYRNVGSKLEQYARTGKPNRRRRRCANIQSVPDNAFPDVLQAYDEGVESSYADNEYILGQIEQLMRG